MAKTGMGTCPKCGNDNIEYLDLDYEGDYLIHVCKCNDCHLSFREYERLEYDGYSYDDEDGKYHDYDAKGNEIGR